MGCAQHGQEGSIGGNSWKCKCRGNQLEGSAAIDGREAIYLLMEKMDEGIWRPSQLAFGRRYIERAADHITNISGNVFFPKKGKRYELNK